VSGPGDNECGATSPANLLRIHAVEPHSMANGPGTRFVIWFQGCGLGCPGCFNPRTHAHGGGELLEVDALLRQIEAQQEELDGVSISGGEPFEQPRALLALAAGLRERTDLSLLVFSGLTLEEIRRRSLALRALRCVDVLIDGPYVERLGPGVGLRGSANQRIHLLSDRHRFDDLESDRSAELVIDPLGRMTISGIDPPRVRDGTPCRPSTRRWAGSPCSPTRRSPTSA
jgi:anaerobic ribonucleoside-triphosphate reductase activating protein